MVGRGVLWYGRWVSLLQNIRRILLGQPRKIHLPVDWCEFQTVRCLCKELRCLGQVHLSLSFSHKLQSRCEWLPEARGKPTCRVPAP